MNIHVNQIEDEAVNHSTAEVLWVPSEQVVVRQIPRPTAPKRKWSSLVPWLLEDQVLQSVDDMHFVIVEQTADSELDVLTVSKSALQHWLGLANNVSLSSFSMLPDFLALPWKADSISVGQRDDVLLVRYGYCRGFAVPADMAWLLIEELLEASEAANKALKLYSSIPVAQVPEKFATEINAFSWSEDCLTSDAVNASLDKKLVATANLLTGEFYQRPDSNFSMKKLLGVAALILILLLSFGYFNFSNQKLSTELESLQAEKAKLFSSLFPSLRYSAGSAHNDIELFLEQSFKQRESLQVATMNLLSRLDGIISNCDCEVGAVHLDEEGGELLLTLNGAVSKLDSLVIPGFEVMTSAGSENTEIQLVIKRGGR